MKKPESLKDWIVVRNTADDRREYYSGSFDEFLDEECDPDEKNLWVGVPFANWTSDDLMEIFTYKLEDANEHRWDWIPKSMLENMKKIHLTEAEKFSVLMGVYTDWRAY